jgi:hypothetical protein
VRYGIALVVLAACAACSASPEAPVLDMQPVGLQTCSSAAVVPPTPPTPRTVEAISQWAVAVYHALDVSEASRKDCAGRLAALNSWIDAQRKTQGR